MKYDSHPATLALIAAAGIPMLIAPDTLANSAKSINVDFIDGLSETGGYLIGLTSTNHLAALLKAEDGMTVDIIGLASYDLDGQLIFALAQLAQEDDGLYLQVQSGGVLMRGEKALKLDPRIVALKLMKDRGKYLGTMTAKNEGHELIFDSKAQVGTGTPVELTMFFLAKKSFVMAENKATGIILVTEADKSGTRWIATGKIGHFNAGRMENVTTSDLSAFGIGIPPVVTRAASVGRDRAERVAA